MEIAGNEDRKTVLLAQQAQAPTQGDTEVAHLQTML